MNEESKDSLTGYEIIVSVLKEWWDKMDDSVVLVRCKDCKHKCETEDGEYNPHDIVCDYWDSDGLEESDYCSYGERKEE